jgi:hypothetical protein
MEYAYVNNGDGSGYWAVLNDGDFVRAYATQDEAESFVEDWIAKNV